MGPDVILLLHAFLGPLDGGAVVASKGFDPLPVLVGPLGQNLLGDGVDAVHVAEEMDDVLGPRQQRQVSLDDDAVETVVYQSQQAAEQLAEGFHRSSPGACLEQQDHRTEDRGKSRDKCAVKDFRELKVWQKAHQLTLAVYQITATFPREELYGLTTQLRRSSSSVSANLAEGCGRNGDAELARFCSIAPGSASELPYHLLLARDLSLLQAKDYQRLAQQTTEVKRMLTALLQTPNAER